jgi:phage-related tail fiber protein
MSGLIDKLKDVSKDALGTFVVLDDDDEAAGEKTAPAPPRPSAAAPAPVPGAAPVPSAAPVPGGAAPAAAPDPEFVQQLKAAVDACPAKALPQFRALFDALAAVGDPATRTQLALSAAQASHGFGAAEVAGAIDDRLKLLAGERSAFEQAVKEETEQSVGAKQALIEKTRAEITRKIEEIKALEAKAAELGQAVDQARGTIDENAARFAASYAVVEAELAAERARVAPFLSPAKQP